MKSLCYVALSSTVVLLLSACLGSSSDPAQPPAPPPPPISGDIIRYNHLGLDNFAVESMYHAGDSVWAAGSAGIYVSRNLNARNESEANWQQQLDGYHFIHIHGFDDNTLLALGLPDNTGHTELFRSSDGGTNWTLLKHNFAADLNENDESASIERLLPDPNTGYLYAVGADLLAVSYDQGENWQSLTGEAGLVSRNFALTLHPQHNDLWWGGQNAIEQLALQRFSLNDGARQSWQNLFPAPSTVETIIFDRHYPERVLIGSEGGIALSENYGDDWEPVHSPAAHIFYMAIIQSERFADVWYSARWEKSNNQHKLTFEYSTDRAASWQTNVHPERSGNDGVRDMVLLSDTDNGQDVLWLGLQSGSWTGGGVMRVAVDLAAFN